MRILKTALKKGIVKLQIDTEDDLWYLKSVVEQGDLVKAKTMRSLFLLREGEKQKIGKKPMILQIKLEKIEYQRHLFQLRLSGRITEGPEETELSSYHTIDAKPGSVLIIKKQQWSKYQLQKLRKAETKVPNILITVMDYDQVTIGLLKKGTLDIISEFTNPHSIQEEDKLVEYYKKISTEIEKLSDNIENIIIAGPGFVKEHVSNIIKERNDLLYKKVKIDSTSSATKSGVLEILKRGMLEKIIKNNEVVNETKLIEELFLHLKKDDGLSIYTIDKLEQAVFSGAVQTLLVSEEKIRDEKIDNLAKEVENKNGEVFIISSSHDMGYQFSKFGGLGALLRYRLFY